MTDDMQRARELLADGYEAIGWPSIAEDVRSGAVGIEPHVMHAITAALRAAPEAVALRVAMQSLEQIANAPDDQGAKFNAKGALRFLQTQPVELHAAPEGFVLVPVEPTQEMLDAGGPWNTEMDEPPDFPALRCIWRDMLAARPQGVKDV